MALACTSFTSTPWRIQGFANYASFAESKPTASCKLGNFLEPRIAAITTTVTSQFTLMEDLHIGAALHLVQPVHFQISLSLTTLRLDWRRMQNPVDILPCLHKLEICEAHHLCLVLRELHLKFISVQWMECWIFPAL
jgi:hypothetical protein